MMVNEHTRRLIVLAIVAVVSLCCLCACCGAFLAGAEWYAGQILALTPTPVPDAQSRVSSMAVFQP